MDRAESASPAVRGIGPSAIGHLLRDRSIRLATGLAVAIAIPVAALFYFQYQSITRLSRSSTIVLRQLNLEVADRLAKRIEDSLKAPQLSVAYRIPQQQTEPLNVPLIESTFDRSLKTDNFIDRYYVWSDVGPEFRGEVLAYDRQHKGLTEDVPEGSMLLSTILAFSKEKRLLNVFETTIDGRPVYAQAHIRYEDPRRERVTSFVAFVVDKERLRSDFFPALLASTRTRNGAGTSPFPPLVLTLVDGGGRVVYPEGGTAPRHVEQERTFPLVFFDRDLVEFVAPMDSKREIWRLTTGYADQTIADIVEARYQPQLWMLWVLAGVMALGVFVVARAAAREVRLAELKSNFVSSVSHDLKTPLALIQLFAETLELGRVKSTERTQEYYRIINSEARKLSRLINNLLDFSRIEAGLRRYRLEPLSLVALTRRVLDSLESQFRHNQFTVKLRVGSEVPYARVDPEAVEQAIENLLSNAMKYSPEHREIIVDVDRVDGHGVIRVSDRGIGVPARLQRKIFRKFYRIQTDAGSGPQGTGLGLAIVQHVMRGHGGFVRVESEPGRGSTFTLQFPAYTGTPGEAAGDATDSGDRGRAADVARSA